MAKAGTLRVDKAGMGAVRKSVLRHKLLVVLQNRNTTAILGALALLLATANFIVRDPTQTSVATKETAAVSDPVLQSSRFVDNIYTATKRSCARGPVDIAYFVQVSSENVDLLPRLLARIHHPRNVYTVHIDLKVDNSTVEGIIERIRGSSQYSNVHFLEREPVTYRGISMVTNTLSAMTFLLRMNKKWQYFINLSAADYPTVPAEEQRRLLGLRCERPLFFEPFPRKTFNLFFRARVGIVHIDPAASFARGSQDLFAFHKTAARKNVRTYRSPLLDNFEYEWMKVEAWMMVSRDFVRYAVFGSLSRRLLLYLSNSASSPEHFFATVAQNHPNFRPLIVEHGFRLVVWHDRGRHNGQHPYILDRHSGGILYFWKTIRDSRAFFVRKVTVPNSELMAKIDADCLGLEKGRLLASQQYVEHVERRLVSVTAEVFDR